MKQVVTCQEMKSCDSYTIERMGVPSCVLMERAALKVVEELEKRFSFAYPYTYLKDLPVKVSVSELKKLS